MTDLPLLTLEPLIDAVREGVEGSGWELSGLQKTTSHQFEGRWEGESTRSAYLFFHQPSGPEWVSVDVYLDETGRGLSGNFALVADLQPLGRVGPARSLLEELASLSQGHLAPRRRRPLTLRFRLADVDQSPEEAETEVRFKVLVPRQAMEQGHGAVVAFARETLGGFERILAEEGLRTRSEDAHDD